MEIILFVVRMPFDWRTPFGYLKAICVASNIVYYILMESIFNVSLAIGSCCFMGAFAKDIKTNLNELHNRNTKNELPSEFYKKFCDIIEFHVTAKQ